jgi:acetoin utilization deacetylase AcuC-like enzyme
MTLLYSGPCFLRHQTGDHPENPERLAGIDRRLQDSGLGTACVQPNWGPVSRERLLQVHAPLYVDWVRSFSEMGGGPLEPDTIAGRESYEVALLAAGAVCDAAERVFSGAERQALCLVRPPGHHALAHEAMGFCIFNNVAVAAKMALAELDVDRVLIVDWDIHHGNGTQAAFWEDPRVGFLSIHRWPFYPGTGAADECGAGDALGTTVNLPIEYGTPRREILAGFSAALESLAAKIRPQLVLVSSGFDAHRLDPIGDLGLETEDFVSMTEMVLGAAQAYACGRMVSVLEGGYNPPVLADCIQAHLATMLKWSRRQSAS